MGEKDAMQQDSHGGVFIRGKGLVSEDRSTEMKRDEGGGRQAEKQRDREKGTDRKREIGGWRGLPFKGEYKSVHRRCS